MLDSETRRRIDTARDILVGKVPDPKSQVEQITIALIYKFMDDMDLEAEELGGVRKYFSGDFAKYGWSRLMAPGLGGYEVLDLFSEALLRMPENPGLPPLFRDIFKNAYLPYRDPETLRAFLKVINEFEYDHSERLGDAFEYLLSVLGSQGDAGQFRTPRHIIDFMVAIIDPQKEDTILDPACGTAGFLISAYKHILAANAQDGRPGAALTPDERARLVSGIKGYDISPDMVRLSLANLYLHGFTDPHVYEYDTLTSQERWHEYADVILANPPFMSPKGGIRPHNRFSVQSKRSEVLFVDYIAEHLSPRGRAAVIVPEGIIFQSQNAYKALRKMLVEKYLVGVISLPAGVFNPYSGVKTSILWLDKTLAQQTDSILFVKIENDGFDLGAQRRETKKSDLPDALSVLRDYQAWLGEGKQASEYHVPPGTVVEKKAVIAKSDYSLSGERYKATKKIASAWPVVPVGKVFCRSDETVLPELLDGPVVYVGLANISQGTGELIGDYYVDRPSEIKSLKNHFQPRDILYGKLRPNLNKVWFSDRVGICSTDIFVIRPLDDRVLPELYAYIFRSKRFNEAALGQLKGAQLPRIGWKSFAGLRIPLPPLAVQEEIVAELDSYQKIIDGARQVVENYRPRIPIDPDWPLVTMESIGSVKGGKRLPKGKQYATSPTRHPYIRVSDFADYSVDASNLRYISEEIHSEIANYVISEADVYISIAGTIGLFGTISPDLDGANLTENAAKITIRNGLVDKQFLSYVGMSEFVQDQIMRLTHAVGVPKLALSRIRTLKIPLPELEVQQEIVGQIDSERDLVAANRDLITRFEQKIQDRIARVWGEE